MTKNTIEFEGDDRAAIAYIQARGYASYSSMVNVRDKKVPMVVTTQYYTFGKELHSRFLEKKKLETLSVTEEKLLKAMVKNLERHPVVNKIMEGAETEVEFNEKVNGLPVYGRIDILNSMVADLKTTRHGRLQNFAASMDFLQAALYTKVTKRKDFYYVGISKEPPHEVMVFNVHQYPKRMAEAVDELNYLTKYIKRKM